MVSRTVSGAGPSRLGKTECGLAPSRATPPSSPTIMSAMFKPQTYLTQLPSRFCCCPLSTTFGASPRLCCHHHMHLQLLTPRCHLRAPPFGLPSAMLCALFVARAADRRSTTRRAQLIYEPHSAMLDAWTGDAGSPRDRNASTPTASQTRDARVTDVNQAIMNRSPQRMARSDFSSPIDTRTAAPVRTRGAPGPQARLARRSVPRRASEASVRRADVNASKSGSLRNTGRSASLFAPRA